MFGPGVYGLGDATCDELANDRLEWGELDAEVILKNMLHLAVGNWKLQDVGVE